MTVARHGNTAETEQRTDAWLDLFAHAVDHFQMFGV